MPLLVTLGRIVRGRPWRTVVAVCLAASGVLAGVPDAGAGGAFGWFAPGPAPAGWKHLRLPAGGAILSYPPSLTVIRHDILSLSVAKRDSRGNYIAYLNATPQQGERLATWPDFRLARLRGSTASSVREEARAVDLPFRGGDGSCVMDVYVTRAKSNHYREIACFVQGRRTGSVLVAAAPASGWDRVAAQLQRAVSAYRVTG
jgi:hypothetical protein